MADTHRVVSLTANRSAFIAILVFLFVPPGVQPLLNARHHISKRDHLILSQESADVSSQSAEMIVSLYRCAKTVRHLGSALTSRSVDIILVHRPHATT